MSRHIASDRRQKDTGAALSAFKSALTILKESVDGVPVPGLKAGVGGFIAVLDVIEVCYPAQTIYLKCAESIRRSRNKMPRTLWS